MSSGLDKLCSKSIPFTLELSSELLKPTKFDATHIKCERTLNPHLGQFVHQLVPSIPVNNSKNSANVKRAASKRFAALSEPKNCLLIEWHTV